MIFCLIFDHYNMHSKQDGGHGQMQETCAQNNLAKYKNGQKCLPKNVSV